MHPQRDRWRRRMKEEKANEKKEQNKYKKQETMEDEGKECLG